MRINHNIAALNTYRQLGSANNAQMNSMEKLSSGLRINSAADDAAGLAISEKMRSQIRGLDMASKNAQDATSLIQTAEGALNETHDILQRMRELANQAANGTNEGEDRQYLQEEMNQLTSEINRIGNTTEFNKKSLLNGNISLTGVAKELSAGSTVSAGLANLKVDGNASVATGDYKVQIENLGGQTVQNVGAGTITSTGVTGVTEYSGAGDDLGLAEGNYKIVIDSTSAKTTSSITDDAINGVLNTTGGNNAVTIDANSSLADGTGYEVEVTKTTTINATAVNAGGISNIDADDATNDASEGTYTIKTKAALQSADGTSTLLTDSAISNMKIADNSSYANNTGYKVVVTQVASGGATEAQYKFELQDSGGSVLESTTSTFNNTSGSTSIQLGDISFDVDNQKMWGADTDGDGTTAAGTYASATINLTIGNQVEVTQNSTGDVKTTAFLTDGAGNATQTLTFADGGKLAFDVADDSGQFTRGNTYTTTISYDDTYSIQMKETDGTTNRGTAVTLTEADLANPSNLTNIQIGNAGDGVQIDLDAAKLSSLTSGTTATAEFNVGTSTEFTAQIQKADGSAVAGAGTYALTGTADGQTVDLGFNIGLTHDGTDALAVGETFFSVKDETSADDYRMTLSRDADGNGTYETTDVNKQAFNFGDSVTLGSTGISIDTKATTTTADSATFSVENGITDNSLQMQIGANNGQTFSIDVNDMRAEALGISGAANGSAAVTDAKFTSANTVTNGTNNTTEEAALDITTSKSASAAIEVIDNAIKSVSSERSKLGAFQNRLDHTINNLGTSAENLTAAESRIRDVDMAKEMMTQTKNSILAQASQAMLAQANQLPQGVLQLLR